MVSGRKTGDRGLKFDCKLRNERVEDQWSEALVGGVFGQVKGKVVGSRGPRG